MSYQLHSPTCPISKTIREHYKGILFGILLGITGTLVGQNVQMPPWLKTEKCEPVEPDPILPTSAKKQTVVPVPSNRPSTTGPVPAPPPKTD